MPILDEYLESLNEQGAAAFLAKHAAGGMKQSLWWGIVVTPAIWITWRTLNSALSKASLKCGTFTKGPGRAVCIARERVKILQKKLEFLNKMKSECSKSKERDQCVQKAEIEIEKTKNSIEANKDKIEETMSESYVNEISPLGVAGVVTGIAAGMVMDKAMKIAYRTALAAFSQASRKCGVYKEGPERNSCMSKYKLASLTKQQSILNSAKSNCWRSRNSQDCQKKFEDKLEKVGRMIQLQKDNITLYNKEAATKQKEMQMKRDKLWNKVGVKNQPQ